MIARSARAWGLAPVQITVHDGLDDAIDEVAVAAMPERAFLSRCWFTAALTGSRKKARTLVMRRDIGEAAIAMPLIRGRFGVTMVPGIYWPFRSIPIAEDLLGSEMGAFLASREVKRTVGFALRLGPIYADDPALKLIDRVALAAGWHVLKREAGTTYQVDYTALAENEPWPSATVLKNHRKIEGRLMRIGSLQWLSLRGAEVDRQILDHLAFVEARSWQGSSRDAKFHSAINRQLWETLLADPDQRDRLHVHMLKIEGTLAAWRFQLEVGKLVYGIATSYDPMFSKYSPGLYASTRSLLEARARGYERFDRGSGDSGAKQRLGAKPGPTILDCLLVRGPLIRIIGKTTERAWQRRALSTRSH